jgi:hypothetical protein
MADASEYTCAALELSITRVSTFAFSPALFPRLSLSSLTRFYFHFVFILFRTFVLLLFLFPIILYTFVLLFRKRNDGRRERVHIRCARAEHHKRIDVRFRAFPPSFSLLFFISFLYFFIPSCCFFARETMAEASEYTYAALELSITSVSTFAFPAFPSSFSLLFFISFLYFFVPACCFFARETMADASEYTYAALELSITSVSTFAFRAYTSDFPADS